MSGNFAGSASLDDRRRRRLATHADIAVPITDSAAGREAELTTQAEDATFDPSSIGLRDLIPSDIWKTAAAVTALILCGTAVLFASHDEAILSGRYGQALADIFHPTQGRAVRFLCVASFISAAHLALVIGTIRSRSPRDFRGRYRIWRWAAVLFFGGAMLEGTSLHLVLGDLVHQWIGATRAGWSELNQLVPLTIVAALVTWKLWIDMKLCRSSQIFLGLAAVAGVALLASAQIGQQIGYDHVALVARVALGMNLLAALLLHVRFVAHVNPNPPESSPRTTTVTRDETKAVDRSNPDRGGSKPKKRSQPKRQGRQHVDPHSEDEYAELEEEITRPRRRRTRTRRDGPSAESLKGLTKKQRKQARKEFRDQQRNHETSHRS